MDKLMRKEPCNSAWEQKFTRFVKRNIQKRECSSFIPQNNESSQESVCECGVTWNDHSALAQQNKRSEVSWQWERHSEVLPCDAYGYINFARFGEEFKPYVRLAADTPTDVVHTLMRGYWNLPKPNLLISVTGGAKYFRVSSRLRIKFQKGLMKAALSTGAWVFTGGNNDGVMEFVGEAVRDFGYLASGKAVTVGIAPWGCVHMSRKLIHEEGKWPAKYPPWPVTQRGESNLDSNHSHFLLVDNGTTRQRKAEIPFRTRLEESIRDKMGVPVCVLVMEGGEGTLDNWLSALTHNIPTVIIKGSGRVADILAYAHENVKFEEISVFDENGETMKHRVPVLDEETRHHLEDMCVKRARLPEKNLATYMRQVEAVCSYHDLVSVYEVDSQDDIDSAILNSILDTYNGKKNNKKSGTLKKLELALTWDRVDVARDRILTDQAVWSDSLDPEDFHDLMFEAVAKNKVGFVELFLNQQVDLTEFLTSDRLKNLYKQAPENSILYKLLRKVTDYPSKFELVHVSAVVRRLTGYDYMPVGRYTGETEDEGPVIASPVAELCIWSVLMGYSELSKVFWSEGRQIRSSRGEETPGTSSPK